MFAGISAVYLVVAMPIEERALRRSFGEAYARYQEHVRWRVVPYIY
jgi:protein-S-isoprenylcysteine O-methyltransferase Ste14